MAEGHYLGKMWPYPLDQRKVPVHLSAPGCPSYPFPMHKLKRDEYWLESRLHLDSIPGYCLTWAVCSLHQHLLTQLGQPASSHCQHTSQET